MTYEAHPLAEKVPSMTETEYVDLRESIEANGLREPVMLYEGKILDGRHRAKACDELGIDPETREYEGDDPAEFVVDANLHRRNLTVSQRAVVAVELRPYFKEKARERMLAGVSAEPSDRVIRGSKAAIEESRTNRAQAGAMTGVSGPSVDRAQRVKNQAPDLYEKVKDGTKTVTTAVKEMQAREDKQAAAAAANGESPPPLIGRRLQNAQATKRRVETLVGTCQGLGRGLPALKVEEAVLVSDSDEVAGWVDCVKAAESALRVFRGRISNGGAR